MTSRRMFIKTASISMAASPFWMRSALAKGSDKVGRIIVPFPAGGGTDVVARVVGDRMRSYYPRGLLIENKPGASGRLGADTVRVAEPDGSSMLLTPDFVMTIFPHAFSNLSYEPLKDFAPVTVISKTNYVLSAGPGLPGDITTFGQFVDWCRANPSQAAFSSTSAGAASHFIGLMLSKAIDVDLLHVPFKGGAHSLQALMGGQIPVGVNTIGEVLPQLDSGRLRVLATTGAQRNKFLPDAPTLVETGLHSMDIDCWVGVLMPAGTPKETVNETADWIRIALQDEGLRESLALAAMEPMHTTPDEFAAIIQADLDRWGPVVKASGFRADG